MVVAWGLSSMAPPLGAMTLSLCEGRFPILREKKSDSGVLSTLAPKVNICAPSTKNGRFSGKRVSKTVRFNTASSTSTCPKSGLMDASSVKFRAIPYLMSRPACPLYDFDHGRVSVAVSYCAVPDAYGRSSRCSGGVIPRMPLTYPHFEIWRVSLLGTITHSSVSFLRLMYRRKFIPHRYTLSG